MQRTHIPIADLFRDLSLGLPGTPYGDTCFACGTKVASTSGQYSHRQSCNNICELGAHGEALSSRAWTQSDPRAPTTSLIVAVRRLLLACLPSSSQLRAFPTCWTFGKLERKRKPPS
jgi:hypothetical protein